MEKSKVNAAAFPWNTRLGIPNACDRFVLPLLAADQSESSIHRRRACSSGNKAGEHPPARAGAQATPLHTWSTSVFPTFQELRITSRRVRCIELCLPARTRDTGDEGSRGWRLRDAPANLLRLPLR